VQFPVYVAPTSLSQAPLFPPTAVGVLLPQVPVLLLRLSAVLGVSVTVSQCLLLEELLLLPLPGVTLLHLAVTNQHTIYVLEDHKLFFINLSASI